MFRRVKILALVVAVLLFLPLATLGVLALFNGRTGVSGDLSSSAALLNPPAGLPAPLSLKVVTFNIQDLYLVGKDRPARMRAIGAKLFLLDPDLVGFQEAFIAKDRDTLIKELAPTRLKHFQYYPSGTAGSGLLIASTFPIQEVYFRRFTAANPFYKVWEGDWWAGKGVALTRLALPDGGVLDFYNTHAQAGYGNPDYDKVRGKQMGELVDFIRESRCESAPALLAGDMNCRPGDAEYESAVEGAGLRRVMAGESRIDHIFAVDNPRYTVEVLETEAIDESLKLGERTLSLSDHIGYMSTITIRPAGGAPL